MIMINVNENDLDELMFMLGPREPEDMSYHLMRRLNRPLRHICRELGTPEMYDRYLIRMRKIAGPEEGSKRFSGAGSEQADE